MKKRLGLSLAFLMLTASGISNASEGHGEIKTMASILTGLNHQPSGVEKKQLQKIVDDSHASVYAQTLAQVMIDLDHKVSGADKAKLKKIAKDSSANKNERELANILINLNHKASSDDQHKLHAMQ